MTNQRDPRIRALIVELAQSSASPPTFAELEDLAAEPIGEGPVRPLGSEPSSQPLRGWMVAVAAASAVLVLVGGVGGVALQWNQAREPQASTAFTDPSTAVTDPSASSSAVETTKLAVPPSEMPITKTWRTFGGSPSRTSHSDATGVAKPGGFYWRFDGAAAGFSSSPIVLGEKVVIGSHDRHIYIIDRRLGDNLVRAIETDGPISANAAGARLLQDGSFAEVAYVATESGSLYAVDTSVGVVRWTYNLGSAAKTLVVDESRSLVYVGLSGGQVIALSAEHHDPATAPHWRVELPGPIAADAAFAGSYLYVPAGNALYRIDVDSNRIDTCSSLSGSAFLTPVIADGFIVAANTDGSIQLLQEGSCSLISVIPLELALTQKPAVAEGVIYQPIANGIVAMPISCDQPPCLEVSWAWPTVDQPEFPLPIESAPTVANGLVYLGAVDGSMYVLDAETGSLAWKWKVGTNLTTSPAVTDDAVYLADPRGSIEVIGPNEH